MLTQSIGCRDSEVPAVSHPNSDADDAVTAERMTSTRRHLSPYMESMWNSITSSSHAVSSAVQTHIVPKIPLLGECHVWAWLPVSDTDTIARKTCWMSR